MAGLSKIMQEKLVEIVADLFGMTKKEARKELSVPGGVQAFLDFAEDAGLTAKAAQQLDFIKLCNRRIIAAAA